MVVNSEWWKFGQIFLLFEFLLKSPNFWQGAYIFLKQEKFYTNYGKFYRHSMSGYYQIFHFISILYNFLNIA